MAAEKEEKRGMKGEVGDIVMVGVKGKGEVGGIRMAGVKDHEMGKDMREVMNSTLGIRSGSF